MKFGYALDCKYAKQKHLGCKKVRGQPEATLLNRLTHRYSLSLLTSVKVHVFNPCFYQKLLSTFAERTKGADLEFNQGEHKGKICLRM